MKLPTIHFKKMILQTLIVFVSAIALGFVFNQSIANYFLPKVMYSMPQKDTRLKKSFAIEGVIKPKKVLPIHFDHAVLIEEIYVNPGGYVKAGNPLFRVKMGDALIDSSKQSALAQQREINQLQAQLQICAQNMQARQAQLTALKQQYQDFLALYQAGSLAKTQLDGVSEQLKQVQVQYNQQVIQHQQLQSDIALAKQQLTNINGQTDDTLVAGGRYTIDADGNCRAITDGVLMTVDQSYLALEQGSAVAKFAPISGYSDVYFEAFVDEILIDRIGMYKNILFKGSTEIDTFDIQIVGKDFISQAGKIRLIGDINDKQGIPFLNKYLSGEIVEETYYKEWVIPRSSLISGGIDIKVGDSDRVFVIKKNEGVLGIEYYVKQVDVQLEDVGDDNVSIQPFSDYDLPWIVSNVSHQLASGQRVLVIGD